jgi:hypothetical protein
MFLRTGLWILTLDVDGDCPPVEDVLCQLRVLAESAGRVKRGLTPGQEQTFFKTLFFVQLTIVLVKTSQRGH